MSYLYFLALMEELCSVIDSYKLFCHRKWKFPNMETLLPALKVRLTLMSSSELERMATCRCQYNVEQHKDYYGPGNLFQIMKEKIFTCHISARIQYKTEWAFCSFHFGLKHFHLVTCWLECTKLYWSQNYSSRIFSTFLKYKWKDRKKWKHQYQNPLHAALTTK